MSNSFGPEEEDIIVRFGGGLNTRASEDEINKREASSGYNFILDLKNSAYRSRGPFDLVATTPNAASINGFASLLKTDGTVSLLVQSGTAVYELSSSYTFGSSLATVSASAKLRGRISHNWQLANKVIITDIALAQPVMEWDGTTLANTSFVTETGSTAWTGQFRAKYCVIDNERAIYSHIYDNGSTFPHLIVGSASGNYAEVTVSQKPSTALNDSDPFYLVQPDYRAINGMVLSFDTIVTSSLKGSLYNFTGSSAQDFAILPFFANSGCSGDEALTFIGNDVIFAQDGKIQSLRQVNSNYNVEQDIVSNPIADQIDDYTDWTVVYNDRTQRVHCLSTNEGADYIIHKPLINTELSPWMKFTTTHSTNFTPTAIMNAYDPSDGLEYIFFGDSSGNVYRMEGTGSSGDAGTTSIMTSRRSALFTAKLDATMYELNGWIRYRASADTDISLKVLSGGFLIFDSVEAFTLTATSQYTVYNGGNYYGGGQYYASSLNARLRRERFALPAGTNEYQIEISYSGTGSVDIQEVGFRAVATA